MAKASKVQQDVIASVMHDFKHGELEASGGRRVKNPKQAIAIALREAGASNQESPAANRANLRRTRAKRALQGETRAELYAQAQRRRVPGRSKMTKAELVQALRS